MRVAVRNDNVSKALSIFRKKCSPILVEIRERSHYEKPTAERNRKKKRAVIRERKRRAADGISTAKRKY